MRASLAVIGTLFLGTGFVEAQTCTPTWLPTAGSDGGLRNDVGIGANALVVFDDGSGAGPALYAGGDFRADRGLGGERVARWDGRQWQPLGSGIGGEVLCLAVFDDGTGPALYAGGEFGFAGGMPVSKLARWNGVSWSDVGGGITGARVAALAVYDDGSGPALYAAGRFNAAGGVSASRIARWDGTSWAALGAGLGGSGVPVVSALTVHDDGSGPKLWAGGLFETAGGAPASNLACWDGTTWSAPGGGLDREVASLAVYDDGLGGGPTLCAGLVANSTVPMPLVGRWDGASWSFIGPSDDFVASVNVLCAFDDGHGSALFVGGDFDAGSPSRHDLGFWRGGWTGWTAGGTVRSMAVFDAPDGLGQALYLSGRFGVVGTSSQPQVGAATIAVWNGTYLRPISDAPNGRIDVLEEFDDGSGPALYAGGAFTVAGRPAARVGRWNGSTLDPLGDGVNGLVEALAGFDDGSGAGPKLYAGGWFSQAGGVPARAVARWDGSVWEPVGPGFADSSDRVLALKAFDDGSGPALYAGGSFAEVAGLAAPGIARWNAAGWSPVRNGLAGAVTALEVFDDGSGAVLVAGGEFEVSGGGVALNHVGRWDGVRWSALGDGFDGDVHSLAVHDDGQGPALYASGLFTASGATPVQRIARWNGTSWEPLGSGLVNAAFGLVSFDDGSGAELFAAGSFLLAGGVPVEGIAKWNGVRWAAVPDGFDPFVRALRVFQGDLYAGGQFTHAYGAHDSVLARLHACQDTEAPTLTCPASVSALAPLAGTGVVVHFTVTATDDVDPSPLVVCTPPSGSVFPLGTTQVTCTATDASGKQSSCDFPVTVERRTRRR